MRSNPWFVFGLIVGAGAGAAAALCYTPMSGRDLLDALRAHFSNAQAEARAAGREAEAEILTRYQQIRTASVPVTSVAEGTPGRQSLAPRVP